MRDSWKWALNNIGRWGRISGTSKTWGLEAYMRALAPYISKKSRFWSPEFSKIYVHLHDRWELLWCPLSAGIYWFNFLWKRVGVCAWVCVCEYVVWSSLRTNSAHNKWSNFLQKLITVPIQTANVDIALDNLFDSGNLILVFYFQSL